MEFQLGSNHGASWILWKPSYRVLTMARHTVNFTEFSGIRRFELLLVAEARIDHFEFGWIGHEEWTWNELARFKERLPLAKANPRPGFTWSPKCQGSCRRQQFASSSGFAKWHSLNAFQLDELQWWIIHHESWSDYLPGKSPGMARIFLESHVSRVGREEFKICYTKSNCHTKWQRKSPSLFNW